MAKQKINDRQLEHETVIFSGTPARVVTISESYSNFKALRVTYVWVDHPGTVVLDTSASSHNFSVIRKGNISGAYRVQIGACAINLSGTTVTGDLAGAIYTHDLTSTGAMTFKDNVGDLTISRVVGIR